MEYVTSDTSDRTSQTQKRSICACWRSDLELGLHGLRRFCNLIRAIVGICEMLRGDLKDHGVEATRGGEGEDGRSADIQIDSTNSQG